MGSEIPADVLDALLSAVDLDQTTADLLGLPQSDLVATGPVTFVIQGQVTLQDGDLDGFSIQAGSLQIHHTGPAWIDGEIRTGGPMAFTGEGVIYLGDDLETTLPGSGISIETSPLVITGDRQLITHNGAITLDEVLNYPDTLTVTIEDGVTTASRVIAAIDAQGTYDASNAEGSDGTGEISVETIFHVTSGGEAGQAMGTATPSTGTDNAIELEAVVAGEQFNDLAVIYAGTLGSGQAGDEIAAYAVSPQWTLTLTTGTGNIVVDDNVGIPNGKTLAGLVIESAGDVHLKGKNNDIDLVANSAGDEFNDLTVVYFGSLDANQAGAEFAMYNPANNSLAVHIADGVTTANQVIAAIDAQGTFDASSAMGHDGTGTVAVESFSNITSGGTSIFARGTLTPTITLNNEIDLIATAPGANFSGLNVDLDGDPGVSAGDETATYNAGTNTLTITIEDGVTTANQIIDAIDAEVTGTFDASNSGASDGTGVVDDEFFSNVTSGGSGLMAAGTIAPTKSEGATIDVDALSIGSTTPILNDTELDAAVTVAGSIDINTTMLTLDAPLYSAGGDSVTITNSGLADINEKITSAGTVRFDDSTTGSVRIAADIETTNAGAGIYFDHAALTLSTDVAFITNDGPITLDEVRDDTGGAWTLTIRAGTGNVVVDDNVGVNGGNALGGLVVDSAGDIHFSGAGAAVNADVLTIGGDTPIANDTEFDAAVNVGGAVDIHTATLTLEAGLSTTNGGTVTITNTDLADVGAVISASGSVRFDGEGDLHLGADIHAGPNGDIDVVASPVTLLTDIHLDAGSGVGSITLGADVSGNHVLQLTADTGSISFAGKVGAPTSPIAGILANSAFHADFADAVVLGAQGLDVTTGTAFFDCPVTTTAGGAVSIHNSGLLTLTENAEMILDGPFSQTGPGDLSTAAAITTTQDDVVFTGSVNLADDVALNTGNDAGAIRFLASLDGPYLLTLTAGTGDVEFAVGVGQPVDLTGLLILSAGNVLFAGPVETGVAGLAVTHTGLLTVSATAPLTLDGPFTQLGTGLVQLGADIATSGGIVGFAAPVTLTADVSIESTGGDMAFSGVFTAVAGMNGLTLTADTGSVLFNGPMGAAGTMLGGLVVESAATVTFETAAGTFVDGNVVDIDAAHDIVVRAAILGAKGLRLSAGADGSGSLNVETGGRLEATDTEGDVVVLAGGDTGEIGLAGSVTAQDQVLLSALGGAITQTEGTVIGNSVRFEAGSGIYGINASDGSVTDLFTAAAVIQATTQGPFDILLVNARGGADAEVTALSTRGGNIRFEQAEGHLTVTGNVTTGSEPDVDGGDIELTSAEGLTVEATISSGPGAGGSLTVKDGVVLEPGSDLIPGAGDMLLNGETGNNFLIITINITRGEPITLVSDGDIVINANVVTTVPTADITLIADNDGDGRGGVTIQPDGFVNSARDIHISGADTLSTTGTVESVTVQQDQQRNQFQTAGSITLVSSDNAPDDAVLQVEGRLETSGAGDIVLEVAGTIEAATTITAIGGDIHFNSPVALTGNTVATTVDPDGPDGSVTFQSTVSGPASLETQTGSGSATFKDRVGINGSEPAALVIEGGDITFDKAVTVGGPITIMVGGTPNLGERIATTQAGAIRIETPADVTLPVLETAAGAVDIETGGTITAADIVSLTGSTDNAIALDSTTGDILLGTLDAGSECLLTLRAPQGQVIDNLDGESANLRADRLVIETRATGSSQDDNDVDVVVGRIQLVAGDPRRRPVDHGARRRR